MFNSRELLLQETPYLEASAGTHHSRGATALSLGQRHVSRHRWRNKKCDLNPCWLMTSWGIVLPIILGIIS